MNIQKAVQTYKDEVTLNQESERPEWVNAVHKALNTGKTNEVKGPRFSPWVGEVYDLLKGNTSISYADEKDRPNATVSPV